MVVTVVVRNVFELLMNQRGRKCIVYRTRNQEHMKKKGGSRPLAVIVVVIFFTNECNKMILPIEHKQQ